MARALAISVAATVALVALVVVLYATNVVVPANWDASEHGHKHGSPAPGRAINSLSNDVSYLYNANGGVDSDGVVYDRWCNNSPAAVSVRNNGNWRIKAIDRGCFGEGAFFYTSTNYDAHRTASYRRGDGSWVWGPVREH